MSETEKTEEEPNTTEEQPADEAKEQPPPTSEPEAQPESTEEEAVAPTDEQKPEAPEVTQEEDAKRTASVKEASEPDAGKKVDLETFMPPDFSPEKKDSLPSRRPSGAPGEPKPLTRKSRFGPLSSKARIVLGSIVDIKANVVEGIDRRGPRYQNTYKLDSSNPFNAEKVDKILQEVMHEIIDNLQYDPEKCSSTAKYASMQIRSKVKQLEFDRYKLVCVVTIGEKNSQDVFASCRFLWDTEKDRYSYYSLENTHVYAIAYCFGLYYE